MRKKTQASFPWTVTSVILYHLYKPLFMRILGPAIRSLHCAYFILYFSEEMKRRREFYKAHPTAGETLLIYLGKGY